MIPGEINAYLGLLSFILIWLAVFYVLYKNPREFDRSISHHAAKNAKVYITFASLVSSALCLFLAFIILWVLPNLSLSIYLVVLFLIAIALELLTTWIPLTEGRKFHVHNILSHSTALLMPIIVIGIILTTPLDSSALFITSISTVTMVGLLIAFFIIPATRRKYLIYQSIYIIAFQLAIISLPFLG